MTKTRSKRRLVLFAVLVLGVVVVVLNWTWGRLPGEPARTGEMVRIGDVSVRYLERPGEGPAVVLVHGLPGTAADFGEVTPLLEGRHTVAFDRPGFGFSSGGFHDFDEQVATLHRLLDRLGLERPVLVGHSYGGALVLAYAARHPERVRGLVLVDAAAGGERSGGGFERAQARLVQVLSWPVVQPLANLTFSQLMRTASVEQVEGEAFDPDPVDDGHKQRVLGISMQPEDLDAYAGEQLEADDVIEEVNASLPSIQTQAIVIHGVGDKLISADRGRQLARELPHAELVLVPTGHMAPYTRPGVVAAAAKRLLPLAHPAGADAGP